jgi:hypothetical protein
MALLNFHKTFAPLVEAGTKRQTIRAERKRPITMGEVLYLYTGCRTKAARKLGQHVCMSALPIRIQMVNRGNFRVLECWVNGRKLSGSEIQDLAQADGFEGLHEFKAWFLPKETTEFHGQLIQW